MCCTCWAASSLARTKGATDEKMRGQGWGIVLQGLFLFKFDLIHGLLTPNDETTAQ